MLGRAVGAWVLLVSAVVVGSFVVLNTAAPLVLAQREVVVQLSEYQISPDVVEVFPNTQLTFRVENSGDAQHDLTISDDRTTGRMKPGETAVLEAGVIDRPVTIWCSIKGHRDLGMEARVVLADADD